MTTPTDTAKLADEIEALAKEATPGPWGLRVGGNYADDVWVASDAERPWESHMALKLWSRTMGRGDYEIGSPEHKAAIANAAMIVALVNNAPAIVSALRERDALKEEVERLRNCEALAKFAARYSHPERRQPHCLVTAEELLSAIWHHPSRAALGGAG